MKRFLKFNHYGLAVNNSLKTQQFLLSLDYTLYKDVLDNNQNIRAALMQHKDHPDIEIISKINHEDVTPIDNILKHNLSATYHICYECSDFESLKEDFKKEKISFKQVVKKMYSPLFEKDVSFHITDSVGLIEIIHT